ncbi:MULTISPECIES: murein hydrolase activator EnvC [Photorhabdus]|uniref:Photorhabdus luminescens subsp. laumondii TTO1 complete genome segment 17/17 n=1 Tax=Photorhabdus laumondii subsp. laumondii (strain DSM 15139 / CIP 105565 / TT01) TaxID=243265 RepID=Q7MY51_PHOLL|nr:MULTISPECIES: murein hydrolase activator EnvC [Photorhabdus]AXG49645.1 murein hydrolase activator EnvC [Photorhabdus laumondii subsp. laumondii]KTL62166.1 peptidase M37 [Photorhabdus laumondii subsp. laumondii]RAW70090.1 murein hydrolase activator EnvC [Photorhabdus sp. S7-51]RAW71561.1 murein hydrolase activator EnvC [Photorhabdus sp. S14-60]RAW77406.1 murein hydrolase activator EnvC [Photorhabdus sp. S15-56]
MADDKEMHSRNYRRNQNSRRNDIFALLFYVFLLVIFSFNTFANQIIDNKNQLKDLQQNIAEKEKSVQQQQQKRSSLLNQLKDQENTISKIGQSLHNAQTQLSKLNKEITFLVSNIKKLEKQQKAQRDMLARQLDAAFRQGQYQGLELMFRGEEGKRGERILAYYSYLNQARQDTIVKLEQTAVDLTEQKKLEQQKQEEQKQVLTEQQQQKQQMEVARNARQKTLSELESSLKKDQKNLAELKQNETRLRDKIAKAEREAKARAEREAREAARVRAQIAAKQKQAQQKGSSYKPTEDERALMARTGGLGRPAGQAIWPVHGKVIHQFGEALQGELRWKGMVISATEGTEVKAISDGRVLLADWLQGYGLVVVIEHGKGDMSLYGYNQSALVSVGQQVRAGQPIALVGNSGGQQQPALYFEIRRQGRAVNPQPWLGR